MTALSPFLLGKVKPPQRQKQIHCLSASFIRFISSIPRLVPSPSNADTRTQRDSLSRPTIYELDSSTLANSTRPTRPALFSRSVHFEHISITLILHLSAQYRSHISDRSGSAHAILSSGQYYLTISWIASLSPSQSSLRAWTRKGSLHPSAK